MDASARSLEGANGILVESDINKEEILSVKKGAWSSQEDSLLINYIAIHGDGRWNFVARHSGLRRTGKSCRLRWKNYLRPDVRRGNFTLQEQLRIMELHCLYGNRWSKIAEFLVGRTDNEIKNYWRSRIVKQAKQLKYDIKSAELREFVRDVWLPKLSERIHGSETECNNNNNHENGVMNYDVTANSGVGALQTGHAYGANWSNTSSISFEAHQQPLTFTYYNLSSNNHCEPAVCSGQPYHNDYDFQESATFGELSNMLVLNDNYAPQVAVTDILSSNSDCGLYNSKWSGVDLEQQYYNSNDFHGNDSFGELSNTIALYDDYLV